VPHVREDVIYESEAVLVTGIARDDGSRTVHVMPKVGEREGVALHSAFLKDFRDAVRRAVPPEALAAVEAWLDDERS
jgi:hypothetical protein